MAYFLHTTSVDAEKKLEDWLKQGLTKKPRMVSVKQETDGQSDSEDPQTIARYIKEQMQKMPKLVIFS